MNKYERFACAELLRECVTKAQKATLDIRAINTMADDIHSIAQKLMDYLEILAKAEILRRVLYCVEEIGDKMIPENEAKTSFRIKKAKPDDEIIQDVENGTALRLFFDVDSLVNESLNVTFDVEIAKKLRDEIKKLGIELEKSGEFN